MHTFYTIDDLWNFCKMNNFQRFSATEHEGKPLIVQSIEYFEAEENGTDGLLPVHLKACHIGKNRNQSSISKEVMEKYMHTFKGRPILGAIYKTDTGEYEFHAHDVEFIENEDGETEIEYIEQPIGAISEISEPYLEYDENEDKTYLIVSGNIFEDYSRASEILKRRKKCKCSVEIAIDDLSWDAKEEVLIIEAFSFRGVTILGYEQDGVTAIEEGMKGSVITIEDFSEQNNSVFNQQKIIEALEFLKNEISKLQNNEMGKKGVNVEMGHLNELLEKYNITIEELGFDVNGMSDEELDAAFELQFNTADGATDDGAQYGDATVLSDSMVVSYELSHEDIRYGLYNLINAETETWVWIVEVYNNSFIYETDECEYFKRTYNVDGDEMTLNDDAVQVYATWLTREEQNALDEMKANYSELKNFKDLAIAEAENAKKNAIVDADVYAVLADCEAFVQLKNDISKLSVDEVTSKAKEIFADYVMAHGDFAMNNAENKTKIGIAFNTATKKKAYGNLFPEK